MQIEQALYGNHESGGFRFLARSTGFLDDWVPPAQYLCTGFGNRPEGARCPLAVFARPLGKDAVAVVQVADQCVDDQGRPGALAFRLLILPRTLYADLGGDPFWIADTFPADWEARGTLPTLTWSLGPPPSRTVDLVQRILNVPADQTAWFLGGAQALLDGGRLVLVRQQPESSQIRDLWQLLPTATRLELWPATFAFGNRHRFHVLAVPEASGPEFEGYLAEDNTRDYPEGRYERALQRAAEEGDQGEIDTLFTRRSRGQMIRLALLLLGMFALVALFLRIPLGTTPPPAPPALPQPKAVPPLTLPAVADIPPLTRQQSEQLADRLGGLALELGMLRLPGTPVPSLSEIERAIDGRFKSRPAGRDPGKLADLGPIQRQLRALLWKYGDDQYSEPGLNAIELIERLQRKLIDNKVIEEPRP